MVKCQAVREMPKYECHKIVYALKIGKIELDVNIAQVGDRKIDGSAMIYPVDEGFAPFYVTAGYVLKHKPQANGYYVVYEDGYKSWSPREVFENGYTRIN